jgi:hypothetical protein
MVPNVPFGIHVLEAEGSTADGGGGGEVEDDCASVSVVVDDVVVVVGIWSCSGIG